MDEGLQSISRAGRGQLGNKLITIEPHGIFGSKFTYVYILKLHGNNKVPACSGSSRPVSVS